MTLKAERASRSLALPSAMPELSFNRNRSCLPILALRVPTLAPKELEQLRC